MRKRQSRLLDRQFQLRTAFSVIAIAMISYLIFIAAIVITTSYNNREMRSKTALLEQIIHESPDDSSQIKNNQNISIKKDRESMVLLKEHVQYLKKITGRNYLLLSIIVTVVLIQAFLLYFFLIRMTHKISGPVFVITRHIQEIIDGKKPDLRGLRNGDQLQELYSKFSDMIKKIDFSDEE